MTSDERKVIEAFHAKLIEYKNARQITDLHNTHADATGMYDDTVREAFDNAYAREIALENELVKMYKGIHQDSILIYKWLFGHTNDISIRRMLIYYLNALIKATA